MIKYNYGKCPKCGKVNTELMFSNNPLNTESTICFSCISQNIDYNNLSQADFFCRTYNLPFDPNIWIEFVETYGQDVFKEYTSASLENQDDRTNLYYCGSTRDLWSKVNKEWEKTRTFTDILSKISKVRDSYIERGRLKWGMQYEFAQLIKLDTIYSRTLRSNRITNPLQKAAVQTLCKIQLEMDEAIQMKDAKAIKDFSSAWSTFAKQADLETMINETKTDDVTTVAELYDYGERKGWRPPFYNGEVKDEIDQAIKDIQQANKRLILESTGLQSTLEDMIEQQKQANEEQHTQEITSAQSLRDLMNFTPEDAEVDTEDDSAAEELDFNENEDEQPKSGTTTVVISSKEVM